MREDGLVLQPTDISRSRGGNIVDTARRVPIYSRYGISRQTYLDTQPDEHHAFRVVQDLRGEALRTVFATKTASATRRKSSECRRVDEVSIGQTRIICRASVGTKRWLLKNVKYPIPGAAPSRPLPMSALQFSTATVTTGRVLFVLVAAQYACFVTVNHQCMHIHSESS